MLSYDNCQHNHTILLIAGLSAVSGYFRAFGIKSCPCTRLTRYARCAGKST